jgi:hypothetical protein
MVNFMGSSYPSGIPVICISENFESLMNKNIVDHKIRSTIGHYSEPYWIPDPEISVIPKHNKTHTDHCVKNKKDIVPFKPGIVVLFVMILV